MDFRLFFQRKIEIAQSCYRVSFKMGSCRYPTSEPNTWKIKFRKELIFTLILVIYWRKFCLIWYNMTMSLCTILTGWAIERGISNCYQYLGPVLSRRKAQYILFWKLRNVIWDVGFEKFHEKNSIPNFWFFYLVHSARHKNFRLMVPFLNWKTYICRMHWRNVNVTSD